MTNTVAPASEPYASAVRLRDDLVGTGTVELGGVAVSVSDAVQFMLMYRAKVLKDVGVERTDIAQKNLETVRRAREVLGKLTDLRKSIDKDNPFGNDTMYTPPELLDYLRNEVGIDPGVEREGEPQVLGNVAQKLPEFVKESVRKEGHAYNDEPSAVDNWHKAAGNRYDTVYNHVNVETRIWQKGWNSNGLANFGKPAESNSDYIYKFMGSNVFLHKDRLDSDKEELNNYIDQLQDSSSLQMTKFKSVISAMQEALDGAGSMEDKHHDMIKNLVGRW